MLRIFLIITIFFNTCAGAGYLLSKLDVPEHKKVFEESFYEKALNKELCSEQMQYLLKNDTFTLLRLLDAGPRIPSGITEINYNSVDLGNYDQCLGIQREISETSTIEGKYCSIELPILDWLQKLPDLKFFKINIPKAEFNLSSLSLSSNEQKLVNQLEKMLSKLNNTALSDRQNSYLTFKVAVCVPKTCTTRQFIKEIIGINPAIFGIDYKDLYCRLPQDKQWVIGDYVATTIFSFLLLLLAISTIYDVYHSRGLKNNASSLNPLYKSFSIYTNSRELMLYKPLPGSIECLDGIRTLAMIWIIANHTYNNQILAYLINPYDFLTWFASPVGLWVAMSTMSVDTFFLMTGILVVYSTLGKTTKLQFIKNIPIFYFKRYMRMFPVLAAMILIQVSILNRVLDGPDWTTEQKEVEKCRVNWWANLLFLQNWITPDDMCLFNTWYLAVDMQLYILSPLVLIWLLSDKKRTAWFSLIIALAVSLIGATAYNFWMEFPGSSLALARLIESLEYNRNYYFNTLSRSSPFVIGMIFGYILHVYRDRKLRMSQVLAGVLWCGAFVILGFITWINNVVSQLDWDNQTVDSLVNSFMRPAWALAIGWIVVACHHGYGGPINWFLSLRCFKVLSRLSFAMYIVHYPLIYLLMSSKRTVAYFSPTESLFQLLANFSLAFIVAYVVTMVVDAPCANLVKRMLAKDSLPQSHQTRRQADEN